jgi:hypothetical protein
MPTPPTPKITTASPARVSPARTAEHQPVVTPQPTRQATSKGTSSSIRTHEYSDTTVWSENVPSAQNPPKSSPLR